MRRFCGAATNPSPAYSAQYSDPQHTSPSYSPAVTDASASYSPATTNPSPAYSPAQGDGTSPSYSPAPNAAAETYSPSTGAEPMDETYEPEK